MERSDNDAQSVWDDFISLRDQVFLVLCGHQYGEATRVGHNALGHSAAWYKADEAPHLADEESLAKGDFVVRLDGFRERLRRTADADLVLPVAR